MFSLIPENPPALTTFGFTISFAYLENSLATAEASPAYPPIAAPIPVGTINIPNLSFVLIIKI